MTDPNLQKKRNQPTIINVEPENLLLIAALSLFIPLVIVGFFAH
ncbi:MULTISPECIES: hypothetical protein [unclassified Thermosynechococcus]|nr:MULTISPECIES: hypothetical protein [unclassified Thermosynechococcus]WNC24268.1 hypothetical protein RHH26_10200 [Thermosynechococcus sp. PP551]WNC26846.1 hypothetical protein RHH27_10195 [Thermosynechococcus sp. PP555]